MDQKHIEENIGYLVIERRTHQLSDGRVLKAGVVDTDHNWASVSFELNFNSIPVVISHCQTYNGNQAVVTRQKEGTTEGFHVRLQEEEANDDAHKVEKIGYIAIEQ